jgi:hypothetical protein
MMTKPMEAVLGLTKGKCTASQKLLDHLGREVMMAAVFLLLNHPIHVRLNGEYVDKDHVSSAVPVLSMKNQS